MAVETEIIRRIHSNSEPVFLEVGSWAEAPEFLELRTTTQESEDFFGKVTMAMTPDFAIALGQALTTAGFEIKRKLENGID